MRALASHFPRIHRRNSLLIPSGHPAKARRPANEGVAEGGTEKGARNFSPRTADGRKQRARDQRPSRPEKAIKRKRTAAIDTGSATIRQKAKCLKQREFPANALPRNKLELTMLPGRNDVGTRDFVCREIDGLHRGSAKSQGARKSRTGTIEVVNILCNRRNLHA